MLFSRIEFLVFFGAVLLFLIFVRNNRSRKLFLLGASYYFYAYWDWRFLILILISTIVDYCAGQGLKGTEAPVKRKFILFLSLGVNLGLLGFFKYFNFFIDSAKLILIPCGLHVENLNIILPIGISFYTLQSISYTIDVYRKKFPPTDDFFDFALFVGFFPQLVAGPIVRATEFLPQLNTPRVLTWRRGFCGFRQFTLGLFKKVFIADQVALFVDFYFENTGAFDCITTWLVVLAYTVQIYCDFSGYSDMAIGIARIMGYDFNKNFNYPYLARRIDDFWRRWHISLSSWLRDYLYISLGGNRKGRGRTYVNLMITMLLGGLWHGASWMYVLWGAWNGLFLAITRFFVGNLAKDYEKQPFRLKHFIGWLVTMQIVFVGFVFFRCVTLKDAILTLRQLYFPEPGIQWLYPFAIIAVLIIAVLHVLKHKGKDFSVIFTHDKWYTPTVLLSMWWLVYIFYPKGFQPFIYFQF